MLQVASPVSCEHFTPFVVSTDGLYFVVAHSYYLSITGSEEED